jgi:hypothetical protein
VASAIRAIEALQLDPLNAVSRSRDLLLGSRVRVSTGLLCPQVGLPGGTIGYRLVKLSDGADDLRSREIGRLDRGDEVEVIGEEGGSLKVRTPSGLEGWVPRVAIVG